MIVNNVPFWVECARFSTKVSVNPVRGSPFKNKSTIKAPNFGEDSPRPFERQSALQSSGPTLQSSITTTRPKSAFVTDS
ncbi:hypothetical protein AJ78_03338 [Emergomyces pasteurianus Ep9510]|uniref:Uncharacterized protein n=1 Tax=Emergomyces pasteurianus Ep9510 TaxID=1447872 RepID=A0A1J9Q8D9_9EURO|nr:hypothetical protein AJ78_03338 [Emergomyces pasteurianus Ep9510]